VKELEIGIIGFGTVGAGVADCLLKNGEVIAKRTGVKPVIKKIADLDIVRDRGVKVPDGVLTTDAMEAIETCQVIVELVGGTTFAKTIILEALKRGKPVVTANKALLAKYGEELFAEAEKSGADIFYEASVGGGIPIIKSLREGLVGNRINRIYGILNGTCNYILTRMERDQADFKEVLADAQKLGYAEANPSLDIDGFDTAHKATIAASLAYGKWFGMDPVYVEGITEITLDEIKLTKELGYKIKLLAIIKQNDGNVEIRVHPTLIPKQSMLAKVDDVFNAVMVNGDFVGDTLFYGRGAGRNATASAVVADITDVCLNLNAGSSRRLPGFVAGNLYDQVLPIDNVRSRYYLSLQVADEPGVLAKITNILASYNISISSVVQKERKGGENVSLVILTHLCEEKDMKAAIVRINALEEVRNNVKFIRIEDL
jgi:homoserine dehydrogenase